MIDGSGHIVYQNRPDAAAKAILEIIAEIRARTDPYAGYRCGRRASQATGIGDPAAGRA